MRLMTLGLLMVIGVLALGALAFMWASSVPAAPALSASALTATAFCNELTSVGGRVLSWELFGTPTPNPDATATPTMGPGDVARGEELFHSVAACDACHSIDSSAVLVGPPLMNIAQTGGLRYPDVSAEEYIYRAIVWPDQISPSSKPGIMPITYGLVLNQQQISDLIAYLMSLG
ncbi:MAG: c-type cytochrome [Chloroflexi bacterium]|nr:c-type cytochrome [Chloroflexota bacterium]